MTNTELTELADQANATTTLKLLGELEAACREAASKGQYSYMQYVQVPEEPLLAQLKERYATIRWSFTRTHRMQAGGVLMAHWGECK